MSLKDVARITEYSFKFLNNLKHRIASPCLTCYSKSTVATCFSNIFPRILIFYGYFKSAERKRKITPLSIRINLNAYYNSTESIVCKENAYCLLFSFREI